MKKIIALILAATVAVLAFTSCGKSDKTDTDTGKPDSSQTSGTDTSNDSLFDSAEEIGVISREDGSGTRGAFIELFGIEQKDEEGNKVDKTIATASVTNNTSVMMTTVSGDLYAIGYISLGSLNNTVKAVKIDGAEATVENIKNGSYKVSRPFNVATKGELSDTAKDFLNFIMSKEGQSVISDKGYIASDDNAPAFSGGKVSGTVKVAGSSSVTPVMEKLKEAYEKINPDVTVEVQQSDSSTGMSNTIDGICDIGMASRELKDSEKDAGLEATVIALDGIAVIVNNDSPVDDLTSEQVCSIYTGESNKWSDILGQ